MELRDYLIPDEYIVLVLSGVKASSGLSLGVGTTLHKTYENIAITNKRIILFNTKKSITKFFKRSSGQVTEIESFHFDNAQGIKIKKWLKKTRGGIERPKELGIEICTYINIIDDKPHGSGASEIVIYPTTLGMDLEDISSRITSVFLQFSRDVKIGERTDEKVVAYYIFKTPDTES